MTDTKQIVELSATLKAAGLKQAWAAKKLGITPGYLGSIFKGRVMPSNDLLLRVQTLTGQIRGSGLDRAV